MARTHTNRWSLLSHGVFYQFLIGIALVAVMPVLVVWGIGQQIFAQEPAWLPLLSVLLVLLVALMGFLLLRRQPDFIMHIRQALERLVRTADTAEAAASLPDETCDMAAIDDCVSALIGKLERRSQESEHTRERLESQLAQAHKMESMQTMAIGMTHDFNNLLAAILGNISIVIRGLRAEPKQMEHALQVEATALQAVELTDLIRTYSGRGNFTASDLDLASLIREMQPILHASVAKGIVIKVELADTHPSVHAPLQVVRQVIASLVANAAESYPEREGLVVVSTGTMQCGHEYLARSYLDDNLEEGCYAYVDVRDQGCGMAPAVAARMFDPFFTTKLRAHGLGLAVVLGAVRVNSGAVVVDTAPGEGTGMRVLFPQHVAPPPA